MPIEFRDFDRKLQRAVRAFWTGRRSAATKQAAAGHSDQGNRSAVTGGKNLNSFRDLMSDIVRRHAPPDTQVHKERAVVALPGFFRPSKLWDIVVMRESRLLAALELKSLCGPSFGNNANNRCEEAIGNALDFRKAQSEGSFGSGSDPFLGYFILVEDGSGSNQPVAVASPHFPTDSVFQGASYQMRMKILCQRLVEQRLYDSAAVLTSPSGTSGASADLSESTSLRRLLLLLAGRLLAET